jgi:hypothetical protein
MELRLARTISSVDSKNWNFKSRVLYSAYKPRVPLVGPVGAGTADRFQREVTMESTTLTGPVLYLLIAWGIVTAIFVVLFIWRSVLSSHEDDQIFLDAAEEHMAREQRELVAKITSLSRPLLITGVLSGVLLLIAGGLWIYKGLSQF